MQWASERVQRTGSGRVSQDVSARGMAMSEVKDGDSRVRCKTSSGVDCSSLRAHACDGRCWSSRARAAQSSLCLQETRRASDAAAKPFRQLPRRYNFISLLCNFLINPANSSSTCLDRINAACSLRLPYHLLHLSRIALGLLG